MALIHTGRGEIEEAFRALEQGIAERAAWLIFLHIDPFLARLRGKERFAKSLRQVYDTAQ